jgi:LemA protein
MKKTALGCGLGTVVAGILGVGLVALLLGWSSYNRLVGLDEGVTSAWSQVENVYQRRADLIPNLVATVRGASEFESQTLQEVVDARSRVGNMTFEGVPSPEQMQQFQQVQDGLSSALSRLLAVVEDYPELKATEAYRDLQVQIEGSENRIAVERNRFNEAARAYNTARRRFPAVIVANLAGFEPRSYFEATAGAERPPEVEF